MIAVSELLNQLSPMQQLKVESTLQSQFAFDSTTLMVFNSIMIGESREETVNNCNLSIRSYNKAAFPIRTVIQQTLGIIANSKRDLFLAEVNSFVHNSEEVDNTKRLKELEELFHQMKRYSLEQESAELLDKMVQLSTNSPLRFVYHHLFQKYSAIEKLNNQLYSKFEKFNIAATYFLDGNPKGITVKDLIVQFKEIRTLAVKNHNPVSEAILNTTKLVLATHFDQVQLLKQNNWTLGQLIEECKKTITNMHFGCERAYLENILSITLQCVANKDNSKNTTEIVDNLEYTINKETYNFGFEITLQPTYQKQKKTVNAIDQFVFRLAANVHSSKTLKTLTLGNG